MDPKKTYCRKELRVDRMALIEYGWSIRRIEGTASLPVVMPTVLEDLKIKCKGVNL